MCMKNWNMTGFILFICHMFSSYSFWANLFFILWFSLIFHCLKAGSVPCPWENWWVLIWPPEIVSILDGSYWTLRDKLQLKCNRNKNISIWENASEDIVCNMLAILFWSRCAKGSQKSVSSICKTYKLRTGPRLTYSTLGPLGQQWINSGFTWLNQADP